MARATIRRVKKVLIGPEPPEEKDNFEQVVIPVPTRRAAKNIGYDRLMGTGKGHNKSVHEKAYSSLYKLLDSRQRVLIMQMKAKNKKLEKRENPESAYVDPRPNGDYLVERNLNSRRRKGLLQYQMLWKGFPLEMASWEPITLINGDISTLVVNFYKEFPGKSGDPVNGHNEYLEKLEEEKKAEAEKNANDDAVPEAELIAEASPRRGAKKTKIAGVDNEVKSDVEANADANTAFIGQNDEGSLADVRNGAAQTMQPIPTSRSEKAVAASPTIRKSSRDATQEYRFQDKALSHKVKLNPNSLPDYFTSIESDAEEIQSQAQHTLLIWLVWLLSFPILE